MKSCLILVSILLFVSCSKKEKETISEARYSMTITGKWTTPAFAVPAGAHFTTFVGMVHNNNAVLWKEGTRASAGTEFMAEIGNGTIMLTEIDSMTAAGNASSLILFLAPDITGSRSASLYLNSNYSFVSFISMLAPTPDWFTGVSGINLFSGNKWVQDTTVTLFGYDAGTEEGDVFNTNNLSTSPQQLVQKLTPANAMVLANGNPVVGPIVTARFTRQ